MVIISNGYVPIFITIDLVCLFARLSVCVSLLSQIWLILPPPPGWHNKWICNFIKQIFFRHNFARLEEELNNLERWNQSLSELKSQTFWLNFYYLNIFTKFFWIIKELDGDICHATFVMVIFSFTLSSLLIQFRPNFRGSYVDSAPSWIFS